MMIDSNDDAVKVAVHCYPVTITMMMVTIVVRRKSLCIIII